MNDRRPQSWGWVVFGGSSMCRVMDGTRIDKSSCQCWHVVTSVSSYKWTSLCLWRSCQLRPPSEQTGHGQEDLINKPLSIIWKSFILSQAASVGSSSIMNPQSPPRGYGFCFLISTLAPYWITVVYIRDSFSALHRCVDETESASQVQEVSLFLWGMRRGIGTELARGWKAIAKDSIWFEVSLFLWILPYPVPAESPVWFSVQHYVGWGACDLDMPRYVLLSQCPKILQASESFPSCSNSATFSISKRPHVTVKLIAAPL